MATYCPFLAWENSMDRGAWQTTYSPRGDKELDTTEQLKYNNAALYPKLPSRSEKASHEVGDSVCHTNQLKEEENPRVGGCHPYTSSRKICNPKDNPKDKDPLFRRGDLDSRCVSENKPFY